jgi:hypothetical protein
MKVLQSSRDALNSVRLELDAVRAFVEQRDQAIVDLLDKRLPDADAASGLEALVARLEAMDAEQAGLRRAISVKLDSLAGTLEAVQWRTQEGVAALATRVGDLERMVGEKVGELGAALRADLAALREGLESRQTSVAEEIVNARLAEGEKQLADRRDQIMADLVADLTGALKPRERARIAGTLRQPDSPREGDDPEPGTQGRGSAEAPGGGASQLEGRTRFKRRRKPAV